MSLDDYDESSPGKSGSRTRPARVIIVDARAARAEMLALHVMAAGHRCLATVDPEVALAAVRDERAPDVVVIDVDLSRQRGQELAEQIRMLVGDAVRLVGTTAREGELVRLLESESVFDAVCLKPIGIDEVLAEVETARAVRSA